MRSTSPLTASNNSVNLASQSAAELSAHTSSADDEMIEYTNLLRNDILEAYSGIFEGFKNSPKTQLLIPYAPPTFSF
ncbi:putative armadillo-like helical, importin beta family [Helianthus debilis subsp. tardiflorus]